MSTRKILIALVIFFLLLILAMNFTNMSNEDEEYMEKVLNETFSDYEKNPDNYTVTQAKIISESHVDVGDEISFFGEREWLVEVKLPDGTIVETTVLRDKNDEIGDVIEVAYENNDKETLLKYMYATQTKYVESFTTMQSIAVIKAAVTYLMIATGIAIVIFAFIEIKKSMKSY